MHALKKIKNYKGLLLLSTALTAAVIFTPSAYAVTTISGREEPTNGRVSGGEYLLKGTNWTATGGEVNLENATSSQTYTGSFPVGFYSSSAERGLSIENSSTKITFDGGVIWDDGATFSGGKGSIKLSNGKWASYIEDKNFGNLSIFSGTLDGAIKIRKGNSMMAFQATPSGGGDVYTYEVYSAGNLNISGGEFYVSKDSNIEMVGLARGNLNISGGNWHIGYAYGGNSGGDLTVTYYVHDQAGKVQLTGGKFDIAANHKMTVTGREGSFKYDNAVSSFLGEGTLSLGFTKTFTIDSSITWETGTIEQTDGTLQISKGAEVSLNQFKNTYGNVIVNGILAIVQDIDVQGGMSGTGELKLNENANASFGQLDNFGTITVSKGSVSFNSSLINQQSLKVLNGGFGAININSQTIIDTINLQNSTMYLNEELDVNTLNFDDGRVVFNQDNKPLKLTSSAVILNTADIDTSAHAGILTIKDEMTLSFQDKKNDDGSYAAPNQHFSSDNLTVKVENGAVAEFDAQKVAFDTLSLTKGTAQVKSGEVTVGKVLLGEQASETGNLTVDNGAAVVVTDRFSTSSGGTVTVAGTLSAKDFEINALGVTGAKLSGTGTVNISGAGILDGYITGLNALNVTGGTTEINNNTQAIDKIENFKVANATVNLNVGELQVGSLTLDHGTFNLVNEGAVLALSRSPDNDAGINGEGNSISGNGTLKLLNNTGISFGGSAASSSIGYLGGIEIGTGTATITADTVLGSVKFTSPIGGGTLQINKDATLTISDKGGTACSRADKCRIVTGIENIIRGEGTLNLVNGDGSVFGGTVTLHKLIFGQANGTMTFKSQADVDELQVNSAGANIIVDSGNLNIAKTFGNDKTVVTGSGTLYLKSDGSFTTGTDSLGNLKVGTGKVSVGNSNIGRVFFNSTENGKLTVGTLDVTKSIAVGAGNTLQGTQVTLQKAIGTFASDLSGLSTLEVGDGSVAYINADTQVGSDAKGLMLDDNSSVVVSKTLTVNDKVGNSGQSSKISGSGTLKLTGSSTNVYSSLIGLNKLLVDANSTATTDKADSVLGTVEVLNAGQLHFGGGKVNNVYIAGGVLNFKQDATVSNVAFTQEDGTVKNNGILSIDEGKTVTLLSDITVSSSNKLNGKGTLVLSGTANGTFQMNDSDNFDGRIRIGHGTANIQTNAKIGAIDFIDAQGGVLNVADGKILSVGSIITDGKNQITGSGTLNLTGNGSQFKAPIASLGTLYVTGGTADFYNNINIGTLKFNYGGALKLNSGMTMTVSELTQGEGTGIIYGDGTFVAVNNAALSTGGEYLAAATIGTGTLNFVGNSNIGKLNFTSVDGVINIADNVTVSVSSDFSGIGTLSGSGSATLKLLGSANATFVRAGGFLGNISAENGNLSFGTEEMTLTSLNLNAATATFNGTTSVELTEIGKGSALFKKNAVLGTVRINDGGFARFKGEASINNLDVASGTAYFEKDATVSSSGNIGSSGVLNLDVNTLTVSGGTLTFNDYSRLGLHISRDATDTNGNVQTSGFGRIKLASGAQLDIRSNVVMDLVIDYGLQTKSDGTIFQLVEGSHTGETFVFENNRYSLKNEESCSGNAQGICYRLTQTSSGGEVVTQESGNSNQLNTASAFLDSNLFTPGTKIFKVAEHLDALSQGKTKSKAYLNALTAVAPDVTGAMTQQPIALQSKISNALSNRLNGLMGTMGSGSVVQRDIGRMYGRSGGSPYSSRWMRTEDYYRRSGYYDEQDRPVTRPRPTYQRSVRPQSREAEETTMQRKRWAKKHSGFNPPKTFGMWAQDFYNMADYLSTGKPDGFSTKTTGFAFGGDVELMEVLAVGAGYASTKSSVDTLQRSTDVKGSSFFLYGMYKPSEWFVSSVLNMSKLNYEETKNVSGISVSDSYDGSAFGATLMVGREVGNWTPSGGIRYVSADRKAHTDELGQKIAGISTDVMTLVAEGRYKHDFAKNGNNYWHSEFTGALTYDVTAAGEDAVVNLPNGASYTVKGEDFSPFGAELGTSLAYVTGEHLDVSVGYNLEYRQDYLSHTLTAMFRYSF